jgi:hypothetical protein
MGVWYQKFNILDAMDMAGRKIDTNYGDFGVAAAMP